MRLGWERTGESKEVSYVDENPGHTLWRKYGLSNIGNDPRGETGHWLVCLYLERHPEKQKEYFEYDLAWKTYKDKRYEGPAPHVRYGYFAVLEDAEEEITAVTLKETSNE